MRKIGLIVAVEEEAMRQKYGEGYDLNDGYGTVLYQTAKSHRFYGDISGFLGIFAAYFLMKFRNTYIIRCTLIINIV